MGNLEICCSEKKPSIGPITKSISEDSIIKEENLKKSKEDPGIQSKFITISDKTILERKSDQEYTIENGLRNLGNTCYLNSSIQCLIRNKTLITILKDIQIPDDQNDSSYLLGLFYKIFESRNDYEKMNLSSQTFFEYLKKFYTQFRNQGTEKDPKLFYLEFSNLLIDHLEIEID